MGEFGTAKPIRDAADKVMGRAVYVDDMKRPGLLHAVLVLSDHPHARIRAIETKEALALPGVEAVYTAFNSPAVPYNGAAPFDTDAFARQERLFSKTVRFVGDRVAMVVASDRKTARKAASLVRVEMQPLPNVPDMRAALEDDAPKVDSGGNLLEECRMEVGEIESLEAGHPVFTTTLHIPSYHQAAMEPHGVMAEPRDNTIIVHTPTQNVYAVRTICAKVLGLPESGVRVIQTTMGGSFGSKLETILEPLCAFAAHDLNRPVKLVLSRRQTMVASRRSYAMDITLRSHVQDGRVRSLDIDAVVDAGGYCSSGADFVWAMSAKPFRLYALEHIRYRARAVLTNRPVASAMRGYGSTQLITAMEIHMERLARHLGVCPFDLRKRFALTPGSLDPRTGQAFGSIGVQACLQEAHRSWNEPLCSGWSDEQYLYGTGMALGVHGNGMYPVHTDLSTMTLKMNMDGSLQLTTGAVEMGSGAVTALVQIVAEEMDVPMERIHVVQGDTACCPYDLGCYASRSVYVAGNAAWMVARRMRERLKGIRPEDYGREALERFTETGEDLFVSATHQASLDPMSYAVCLAEVRIERRTGRVEVTRFLSVLDAGRVVNPLGLTGQVEGAVQMGAGMALTEGLSFARDGRCAQPGFKRYRVFRAQDMPEIETVTIDSSETSGPFGAKSIGELACVPVAAAVTNAVEAATGVCTVQLPLVDALEDWKRRTVHDGMDR